MRIIDADKLRFRHTIKYNSNTTRPYTLNCISFDEVQNAPTIKALPIDVLNEIESEIEALPKTYPFINHIDTYVKEDDVKKIIDKYMEGSDKE